MSVRVLLAAAVALLLLPGRAHAHLAAARGSDFEAVVWQLLPVFAAAFAALIYGWGVRALWRRAGRGRGVRRWQAGCFCSALGVWLLAVVSPLDAVAEDLFFAHMVQHLLLMLIMAPLLAVCGAPAAVSWALSRRVLARLGALLKRRPARMLGWLLAGPTGALVLHTAAVWGWHLPAPYEAALRDEGLHALEHLTFVGTSVVFWRVLVRAGRPGGIDAGLAVLYVFAAALQGGLLGMLITFAPRPWYPLHVARAPAWGLDPLDDQQLAGVLMWVPSGVVYLAAALWLFGRWLSAPGTRGAAGRPQPMTGGSDA